MFEVCVKAGNEGAANRDKEKVAVNQRGLFAPEGLYIKH